MKPTCLIQLSPRHVAIAVGSLKENSHIEIHNLNTERIVSCLKGHKDMIDSMYKMEEMPEAKGKYTQWFVSASRDRQLIMWKLCDGRVMRRSKEHIA